MINHKKKYTYSALLFVFLLLCFIGCSNKTRNIIEYKDSVKYNIICEALDENSQPINEFEAFLCNSGEKAEAKAGLATLITSNKIEFLRLSAPNRLSRYVQIANSNEIEKRSIYLPSLNAVTEKYTIKANQSNIIGGKGKAENFYIEFPANTFEDDVTAYVLTNVTDCVNNSLICLKPETSSNASNSLKSNGTLFVSLIDKNNKEIHTLPKKAKICFKPSINSNAVLKLSSFNDANLNWENESNVDYNTETGMYEAYVDHFSWYDFYEPYKKETINNVKIKVVNFQPTNPKQKDREYGTSEEEQLLKLFTDYFGDLKNGVITSEEERIERKESVENQASELALKIKEKDSTQSDVNSDVSYTLPDAQLYNNPEYCVKNAHVTFKVMREFHTFAREELYTDDNGEVTFQIDPNAIYCSIQVAYAFDDNTAVIASPKLIDLDENKDGIIYVNLSEYPTVSLKIGDYSGTI